MVKRAKTYLLKLVTAVAMVFWVGFFAIAVFAVSTPPDCTIFVDKNIIQNLCTTYNEATRSCIGGLQSAYKTLAGAANVAVAGDVVCVRQGTYFEKLNPANSGTANADGCLNVQCDASDQCIYAGCTTSSELQLHYKFDDAPSDGIFDDSTYEMHGTCGENNCPTLSADRMENANSAYSFDGANDRVNVASFNAGNSFTVAGWINPIGSTSEKWYNIFADSIASPWNSTNFGVIYLYGNTLEYWHSGDVRITSGNIPSNAWTFVTLIATNGNVQLFIDGTQVGAWTGNPVFNNEFYIGRKDSGVDDAFFNGKIDDVRVYSKALTQQEVSKMFIEGQSQCDSGADLDGNGVVSHAEVNSFISQFFKGQVSIVFLSTAIMEYFNGCP